MGQFAEYGRLDSPPIADGDDFFTGVNLLDDPASLPPGLCAAGENVRFTTNEAAPRGGFAKLPWTNRVQAGTAPAQPFSGDVLAAEVFRDPNGLEWTIIAAGGRVYKTRENNGASEIPLPPGVTLAAPISFTQTYSGFMMFRGEALDPLIMVSIDGGFVPVAQVNNLIVGAGTENVTQGTRVIPPSNNGDWIGNRLFIPTGDYLEISDYLNPTRYGSIRSQARINEGSSDKLVRFFKLNEDAGVAFKGQSVYIIGGVTGALEEMSSDELTREYGCCAARSCVNVGTDVWFMSEKRGVCSVAVTAEGKTQAVDVPVSRAIQPLIDRIAWRNAAGICGAVHDNKVYFSVPLDDSLALGGDRLEGFPYSPGVLNGPLVVPGARYRISLGAGCRYTLGALGDYVSESGEFTPTEVQFLLDGDPALCRLQRVYENVNNAVLVYDTLKQQWAGYDTGVGLMVQSWFKPQYDGVRRLAFVATDGFINLYELGVYDEVATETLLAGIPVGGYYVDGSCTVSVVAGVRYVLQPSAIFDHLVNGTETLTAAGDFVAQTDTVTLVRTPGPESDEVLDRLCEVYWTITPTWVQMGVTSRAMSGNVPDIAGRMAKKHWQWGELALSTLFPEYSISAFTPGVEESAVAIDGQTADRTLYDRPAFAAPYDPTNANDDHAVKFRQDYSVVLEENAVASGSIVAGTEYFVEALAGAGSIVYNGVTRTAPALFTGVAGVTTYTVSVGAPLVYGPDSYVFLGENGINFERLQSSPTPIHLASSDVRGRSVQLRLQVTAGLVRWGGSAIAGVLTGHTNNIQR